ncbi:tail fiber protein [Salmonella enterica]|nr:tail fiber protein [Salmonella enterica]
MNRTDAPEKQAKPFGINGQREPLLPTTPAGDNTASYELGFPPITMILKSAGGLPPKGQDMNQILFELSSLTRWFSAGALNTFDSSFSGVIGGYPAGSLLWSNDGTKIFVNTVNDNTGDPNTGASGWVELLTYIGIKNASTTQKGIVSLTSSRVSGSETIAATANAVAQNYNDIIALQGKTVDASVTQKGIVQLTSSRVSDSESIAATAKAVAQNYSDIIALQGKTNDATSTNKGIIRVSDSRTSTESGIAASSFAASQNYSDMKGLFGQCGMKSRTLGVTYTNSQSFAVFVSVNAVISDGSSFLSAAVSVDGNTANFIGSQTTNLAGQRATIAFMVPAGATYIVQQFSGTVSDVTWVEVDKK